MSMKVLRRGDDFRKQPENNMEDVAIINNLRKQGWDYCSKSIYKEHMGVVKEEKEEKPESKKTAKRGKNS